MTSRRLKIEIDRRNIATCSVELMTRAFRAIGIWRQRKISRESFHRLDSSILRDVGISEAQRFIEVNNLSGKPKKRIPGRSNTGVRE